MAEVLDFGDTYDAAEGILQELSTATLENIGAMQSRVSEVAAGRDNVLGQKDDTVAGLESVETGLTEGGGRIEGAVGELGTAFDNLQSSMSTLEGTIGGLKDLLHSTHEEVEAEVLQTRTDAEGLYQEAVDSVQAALNAGDQIAQQLLTLRGTTEDTLAELEQKVGEFHERITSLGSDTVGDFKDLGTAIISDFTGNLEDLFGDVTSQLTDTLMQETLGGFEQFQDALLNIGQIFMDLVNNLGETLEQEGREILSSLQEHVASTVEETIRNEIELLIEGMVRELAEEVAEQLVLATAGSATTAALGPVLPALAAAKALLGAINEALALLEALGW